MPAPRGGTQEQMEGWILDRLQAATTSSKEALRIANEALSVSTEARDGVLRIEEKLGESPDPAQGKEGKGALKVLAGQVVAREDERKRRDFVRGIFLGAGMVVSFGTAAVGLLKAFGVLH